MSEQILQPTTGKPAPLVNYTDITRTGTYSFLVSLPLLALYEVLMLAINRDSFNGVRLGAEIWIKRFLFELGAGGMAFFGLLIFLIGVAVFIYERKKSIPIVGRFFFIMVFESALYAVILAFLISNIVGAIFLNAAPVTLQTAPQQPGLAIQLALSIGAGLYEEFVFRLILVGGMAFILSKIFKNYTASYIISALIGAFLFSLVHYLGEYGDSFSPSSFTFRFLFGLALNVVFLLRGFGVAAWTHSLYDVFVVLIL